MPISKGFLKPTPEGLARAEALRKREEQERESRFRTLQEGVRVDSYPSKVRSTPNVSGNFSP